ncbi:hypothetical protein GCM10023208_00010 [Erythrobacter westpacificensis]|uniref:Tyr recombinase domain-containing protein n=2 Tax=Erythrobacter westpacificensis TaxID=1055231 RepID=A0ABP9JX30_9SPHN
MAFEIAEAFESARRDGAATWSAHGPPSASMAPSVFIAPTNSLTIYDAWNRYLSDPGSARTRKTMLAYETVRNLVVAVLGKDKLVTDIARQDCRRVMEVLQQLPRHYERRWPGATPFEAIELGQKHAVQKMAASNCNGYLTRWAGMMNWLVKEEFATRNPVRGLRIADPIPAREKRLPFSIDQLDAIFQGEPYADLLSIIAGRTRPESPAHFYVPLIALFSGQRQNEICQQTVDDIVEIDGVHCFVVKADTALGKRVKTASSERVIPIHPALIRARLLEHWHRTKRANESRLWPELPLDRFGYASAYFSKWFARYLIKVGAKQDRTAFHSFRHNFRDAMRAGRVDRELTYTLGGWTGGGSGGASVGDFYGSGFPISALYEAITRVEYPVPALAPLIIERDD